jgi:hypothetical protein
VIVTQGRLEAEYALCVRQGNPTFVYNYLSVERTTVTGRSPLPKGKITMVMDFAVHSIYCPPGRWSTW